MSAYCDQIGAWCREHGILMTGHMMSEQTLESQSDSVGEAMRAYRSFTLPGVDQLCDGREFTTVKQAASAAHQQGCPGVASELYGVTNWDFDFKGHKLQGDWQAALGVTVRVPHLYWCSMHGESKRAPEFLVAGIPVHRGPLRPGEYPDDPWKAAGSHRRDSSGGILLDPVRSG